MSGIFAVANQEDDCVESLLFGVEYHRHLGNMTGGLAFLQRDRGFWINRCPINQGGDLRNHVSDPLAQLEAQKKLVPIKVGIGIISDFDRQPLFFDAKFGNFTIATIGLVNNLEQLAEDLKTDGPLMETRGKTLNTVEIIGKLICKATDIVSGIKNVWSKIDGSISLVILTNNGELYAARDRFGVSHLEIARRKDGIAVASEQFAFYNLGYISELCLKPGSIVQIRDNEIKILEDGDDDKCRFCPFMWIYTGWPNSIYEGQNVGVVRHRCGAAQARREDPSINADYAFGIPASGTAYGYGFCNESRIPIGQPLSKYTPIYGKSYQGADQQTRDLIARMKLVPTPELIKNLTGILLEDSLVRGTQLEAVIKRLFWGYNAKGVHVRPCSPPILWPCRYLRATRTIDELRARQAVKEINNCDPEDMAPYIDPESKQFAAMIERIRQSIHATSLRYQLLDDMIEAIGVPRERLCLYCWNGERIDE